MHGRTLVLLLVILGFPPAHAAGGAQVFSAPFECGTDELARQTGVMETAIPIPGIPGATHGCLQPLVEPGTAVWTHITAGTDGIVTVRAVFSADPFGAGCGAAVNAGSPADSAEGCSGAVAVLQVAAGETVLVGAFVPKIVTDLASATGIVNHFDVNAP